MKHKWHKEIKAWADGAEIEARFKDEMTGWSEWDSMSSTCRFSEDDWWEYRIKPQPKEWLSTSIKDNTIFNTQPKEPLIIPEEPVAVVYSMQDGYVGQMIKKGLPHKTLLYAHLDEPQPKEPQYLYVWLDKEEDRIEFDHYSVGDVKEDEVYKYIGKIKLEGEEDV